MNQTRLFSLIPLLIGLYIICAPNLIFAQTKADIENQKKSVEAAVKKDAAASIAEELKAQKAKTKEEESKKGPLAGQENLNSTQGRDTILFNIYHSNDSASPLLGSVPVYKSSSALGIFEQSYNFYPKLFNRKGEADKFKDLFNNLGFAIQKFSDPKGVELKKTLDNFIAENSQSDSARVVIYLSGHIELVGEKYYYLAVDTPKPDNKLQFERLSLDIDDFLKNLDKTRIKSILVIFDACGASKIYENSAPVSPKVVNKQTVGQSRQVIFSCADGQLVKDDVMFLSSIFDVLIGKSEIEAKDGVVTTSEMFNFGAIAHSKITAGGNTPVYFTPKGQVSELLFKISVDQKSQLKQAIIPAKGSLITSHKVFIRDTPDVEGNQLAAVAPNTKVNIIGKAIGRDWYLVKFNSVEGFIYAQQLKSDENNKVIVNDDYLNADSKKSVEEFDAFSNKDAVEKRARDVAIGDVIKDCVFCPSLIILGSDEFLLGERDANFAKFNESPVTRINFKNVFGIGEKEITIAEYDKFVQDTKYNAKNGCFILIDGKWVFKKENNWQNPGYPIDPNMPVTCVNYDDVLAYINWLNKKIQLDDVRKAFRLPSEAEWEYAARGGAQTIFYWGKNDFDSCQYANHLDYLAKEEIFKSRISRANLVNQCSDDFVYPAPVGSFKPNGYGIYDLLGNVAEWTSDCWHDSYLQVPRDGSPWTRFCSAPDYFVIRGGSWAAELSFLRLATRTRLKSNFRSSTNGFRIARTVRYQGAKNIQDILFGN